MGNLTLTNILPETVGVMEDDKGDRREIKASLSKLGLKSIEVSDSQHAERLARANKISACILDINMGAKRTGEGLTAAERVKKVNRGCFVGILTNYSTNHRRQARKIRVDAFKPKSSNLNKDVCFIIQELMETRRSAYQNNIEKLYKALHEDQGEMKSKDKADKNIQAFQAKVVNPKWLEDHLDTFVAFDSGVLVDEDDDLSTLLKRIRKNLPEKSVFIARVERERRSLDIPTPFLDED